MGIRVLALVTEAYGGRGGIALYNRDVLDTLCDHPDVDEVVTIPRLMPDEPENLPEKLTLVTQGLGGKASFIRAVLSSLKNGVFDLILCAHINLLPISQLAAMRSGAPQLLGIYGIDAWQPTSSKLVNFLARRISNVYSISEVTRDRFLQWSVGKKKQVYLLPNAIHLNAYGQGAKPEDLVSEYGLAGKKVIMTLGRMSAAEGYKGFDEILEVMPDLLNEHPDLHYLAVGDGDDRSRLQQKAVDLKLKDHVTFTGWVDEDRKADVFRLADAYVMPSYGEGFGFVFLEAMACGLPVVASGTDGGREAVRDGKLGLLVDPKEPQQLKAAINSVLVKPRTIPEGLDYFAFPAFRQRYYEMLNSLGIPLTP